MSVKTAGVGHFQIPTAPAAGTSVTSGAANTYTTSAVQLIASTAAALYITGIYAEEAAVSAATYKSVQLMIGGAGAETVIGQYLIAPSTGSTVTRTYRSIFPPIPVATATRISAKTADSVGALATLISLEVIAASNVVDDGIAVGTVTTVTNQLTAAQIATGVWQDATAADFTAASSIGKALYIANIAPGAAGGHMIAGSNAGTTTFGAFTITGAMSINGANQVAQTGDSYARLGAPAGASVSADVAAVKTDTAAVKVKTDFLPSVAAGAAGGVFIAGSNAATTVNFTGNLSGSVGSVTGAVGSVTGNVGGNVVGSVASVTGAVGSVTGNVGGNVTGSVGSVVGLTAANLDVAISTRLAATSYTVPDNVSITAIKAKTDQLAFTAANKVDANVKAVNDTTVNGAGTAGSPWGP